MTSRHSDAWLEHRQFGIVIDAGSSGSRIHIYSWINSNHLAKTLDKSQLHGVLPVIEPGVQAGARDAGDWTLKTEPGIADFKDRPEDVGEHLEPLLDHALSIIPASEIAHTPIYLMATAGLRLVQDQIREQILHNSCHYIKDNYRFLIGECKDHVQNISGEEEGIYGWVAINYLMGGFDKGGGIPMVDPVPSSGAGAGSGTVDQEKQQQQDHINSRPDEEASTRGRSGHEDVDGQGEEVDPEPHRHTLGFLDMGGASTQIAFEPAPKALQDHADDLTTVQLRTLDGQKMEYHVFVTTFLGYGSNQARRRYVKDFLLSQHKEILEQEQAPGVQIQIEDPCLPRNLQLSETHTLPHVPLTGKGSFKECLERVEVLLNKDVACTEEPCLFNGVHTPPIDFNINTFIGVSEYWYSSHDILGLGGVYDYAEFEKKSAEFCESEWQDIKDRPEYREQSLDRLEMQCFKSAWLSNVLHSGFGIPRFGEAGAKGSKEQVEEVLEKAEESVQAKHWRPAFQSINAIKDIQVTWTLGAMLLISSGSMRPMVPGSGVGGGDVGDGIVHHRPLVTSHEGLPPANHRAPHEESYPERMLDSYNHFMLLAIVLFGLAIFSVYRSRSSKSLSTVRRWLGLGRPGGGGNGSGGGGGRLPFLGRFRRTSGPSGMDYSSLESGTTAHPPRSFHVGSLKEVYLSIVHYSRSIWWSFTSRIWPEPLPSGLSGGGHMIGDGDMIESIAIAGYDGQMVNTASMPMSTLGDGQVAGSGRRLSSEGGGVSPLGMMSHLGGIPPSELGSISEMGGRPHTSLGTSRPGPSSAKSTPARFFRMNKKRLSGDSQSWMAGSGGKDGTQGHSPQSQPSFHPPRSSAELTARSGSSSTHLSSAPWSNAHLSINSGLANQYHQQHGQGLLTPGSAYVEGMSGSTTPLSGPYLDHSPTTNPATPLSTSSGMGSSWKQGWVPASSIGGEDSDDNAVRLQNRAAGFGEGGGVGGLGSSPMGRYKQRQMQESTSAPSSSIHLASTASTTGTATASRNMAAGFGTLSDEGDEVDDWSSDDEASGGEFLETRMSGRQLQQHTPQQQHHHGGRSNSISHSFLNNHPPPTRSASAVPFGSRSYKQRSTGLLSGINFGTGGGAMTSLEAAEEEQRKYWDGDDSTTDGYLSTGSLSSAGGGSSAGRRFLQPHQQQQQQQRTFRPPNIQTASSSLMPPPTSTSSSSGLLGGSAQASSSSALLPPLPTSSSTTSSSALSASYFSSFAAASSISRSHSPLSLSQQQQQHSSTSTSSLVLGRHNISEQDQQLVSRGSSENLRRGSLGMGLMSP